MCCARIARGCSTSVHLLHALAAHLLQKLLEVARLQDKHERVMRYWKQAKACLQLCDILERAKARVCKLQSQITFG
jgi:hypothetical protein